MADEDKRLMADDKYKPPTVAEAPWLIVTHQNPKKKLEKQTFCNFSSKDKSCTKTIVELDGKSILAYKFGWFILRERENPAKYSLWNPTTLHSLLLPELLDVPSDEEQKPFCVLTSSPCDEDVSQDRNCDLLLFFKGLVLHCRPTAGNACSWHRQSLDRDDVTEVIVSDAVSFNGEIYAYTLCTFTNDDNRCDQMFARIKITYDDSTSLRFDLLLSEPPNADRKFKTYRNRYSYLLEASGTLYFVEVIMRHEDYMDNYDISKALVWKLDLSQMIWTRVTSLGDRAFLIGGRSCTWCWAGTASSHEQGALVEKDCIYLTTTGSPTVHSYRLRDDSYSYLFPHQNFSQYSDGPTWFVPCDHHIRFSTAQEEKMENAEKVNHVEHMEEEKDMKVARSLLSEFLSLPSDMLISIAHHMHLFDYMNLCATCKIFRTIIPPPQRRDGCSFPVFMSLKDNNKGICELRDPFETIFRNIKTPHAPHNLSTIEFCKDGWQLLRIEGVSLQYFNPFTGERGEYPDSELVICNATYAFSTCPNSSDCLTVGMFADTGEGNGAMISCFKATHSKWDFRLFLQDPDEDVEFKSNYNSSPKYLNNAFYFIGEKGNLGVFKIVDEEWSWKVYSDPLTDRERETLNSCYLVELEGQLMCVFVLDFGKEVQVFKFKILEKSWVAVDDLGDYMLFLSPASSFSARGKDNTMRNRIYLPRRIGDEIVYYSLDEGKYHALGKNDSMDDFCGMTTQPFCCWI